MIFCPSHAALNESPYWPVRFGGQCPVDTGVWLWRGVIPLGGTYIWHAGYGFVTPMITPPSTPCTPGIWSDLAADICTMIPPLSASTCILPPSSHTPLNMVGRQSPPFWWHFSAGLTHQIYPPGRPVLCGGRQYMGRQVDHCLCGIVMRATGPPAQNPHPLPPIQKPAWTSAGYIRDIQVPCDKLVLKSSHKITSLFWGSRITSRDQTLFKIQKSKYWANFIRPLVSVILKNTQKEI